MRKKLTFYLTAAVAALCLSSCNEPLTISTNEGHGTYKPIRFTTGSGSLDHSITTRGYGESTFITMCRDGIGVFGYNTADDLFNADSPGDALLGNSKLTSSDGFSWEFTGCPVVAWDTSSDDKHSFMAYHPYDASLSTPELTLVQPSTIDDIVDYLVARPVYDQTSKDGVELAFEHLLSRISLSVKLSAAYAGQKYTLTSVSFDGIESYPSFSLSSDEFVGTPSLISIASTTGNITNPVLSATTDVVKVDPIAICPYDYATQGKAIEVALGFEYSFTNATGTETVKTFVKKVTIRKDFKRNNAYNLSVVFIPDEEGGIQMETSLSDYSEEGEDEFKVLQADPVNLSAAGTANCYVVPKAGEYFFDATYKGNSTTESVGDIATVEVLWESFGTFTQISSGALISDLTLLGKTVSFIASEKKGNAVIAAKDAAGAILWAWHVWLTDRPREQLYNNGAGTALDRNLGATSSLQADGERTFGLLYQWGRKDPFLGSGTTSGAILPYNTGTWPAKVTVAQTSQWAAANPMTYIASGNDWLDTGDQYRWMDTDGGKTINDPCPVGYMVPSSDNPALWKTAFGSNTTKPSFSKGYDFGFSETNMHLTMEESCWYPAAGGITGSGTLNAVGSAGNYWTSTASNSPYSRFMPLNSGTVGLNASTPRSYGCSVRCVKEQ